MESRQKTDISIQGLHFNKKNTQDLNRFHHSKPLDLNYKEDSPRAVRKIQILLLPEGSNPDTFREEKAYCKKICMIRNIANPPLASVLLPDTFCNKNNTSSAKATKTQRTAPADSKGFRHDFHHQPARYRTARMDKTTEARPSTWRIASCCAARKHSSST